MKSNSLVFLGFGLICLVNMNLQHRVPASKVAPVVPVPKLSAVPVIAQPEIAPNPAKLVVVSVDEPKKKVSVATPVSIHKLRDRQSEASNGSVDASDSGPKDDKLARPL